MQSVQERYNQDELVDHWVITLQIADPSSRQRGRPTETRPQISDSNIPTEVISGRKSHKGARYQDILTDWLTDRLTVSRKVTSTSTSTYPVDLIEWVHGLWESEWGRRLLRYSRCELLLWETGSWGRKEFGNPEERETPTFGSRYQNTCEVRTGLKC
jgi:hypothetical protein